MGNLSKVFDIFRTGLLCVNLQSNYPFAKEASLAYFFSLFFFFFVFFGALSGELMCQFQDVPH